MTDDNGNTPLNLATKNSLSTDYDEYERESFSEIVDYLKSLPTKHSELLHYHIQSDVLNDLIDLVSV